jgi:aminobenzoyl-glutamate transport protein
VARLMTETIASVAPVIVLSFFAAQFIAQFGKSQLGQMLAMAGGKALAEADLGPSVLMVVFVLVTMVFNLLISSMSAKYAIFAPIFVPMFMMVGIHPALTQCAYRIGDSVTNIVTPLNAYLVVILAVVTRYAPRSGLGTLISMMVPYTVFFTLAWLALLLLWIRGGWELGDGGPLFYDVGTP